MNAKRGALKSPILLTIYIEKNNDLKITSKTQFKAKTLGEFEN